MSPFAAVIFLAAAAADAVCTLPFLTRGLLCEGTPASAAVAAALAAKHRLVMCYETEVARGGTPSVQTLIEETCAEVQAAGVWNCTAVPWLGSGGGAGMAEFITKEARTAVMQWCDLELTRSAAQVHTLKDYNRYCYYVAGLVGVGLSRLFAAGGAAAAG